MNYYSWGDSRISSILRNSFYKDSHLVCRTHQKGIRSNTYDNRQENDVKTFISEIRQYATVKELDEAVLNRLIDRILIGEVRKEGKEKYQEVRIIYNFVGEIPQRTE